MFSYVKRDFHRYGLWGLIPTGQEKTDASVAALRLALKYFGIRYGGERGIHIST
jgi:hypothetical protein